MRAFTPLLFLLMLLLPVREVSGMDQIQVHSVVPPILQNYWESGMRFWSFGLSTVVTDNYIRLTGRSPGAKGYLWNRHANHMESFELNVTLQMRGRHVGGRGDMSDSGIGIWYTTVKKITGDTDTEFFGFSKRFFGVGVILGHYDDISLVQNDNSSDMDRRSLLSRRQGHCRVPSLGELHITITIHYNSGTISVFYVTHMDEEPRLEDYSRAVFCTTASSPSLLGMYHFGVTAVNSATAQAIHEIHSVIMTPLSDVAHHKEEEKQAAQFRLFDEEANATEKELLDG
ncbi:legume-like lectin [Trypanosoma rangeli]|uniref:Legume-like lectin n=1 Tax=Trypanosoma rangeli TaxID=5698 RepID=A0A3R7N8E7_TRYRA|nr:legume-like lectin [Trypanosoma rangeli]RNF02089.1 legume-like lectin [Trypanosoma rangeli]|eukprot:RNF02089.1 legume-like lectin [Trypanosoma rangeli]